MLGRALLILVLALTPVTAWSPACATPAVQAAACCCDDVCTMPACSPVEDDAPPPAVPATVTLVDHKLPAAPLVMLLPAPPRHVAAAFCLLRPMQHGVDAAARLCVWLI